MTAHKIIDGLSDALAWTKATRGGTELPTEADRAFLSTLNEADLRLTSGPHADETRLRCRTLGWAVYTCRQGGTYIGWCLTPAGRTVLETPIHTLPCGNGHV